MKKIFVCIAAILLILIQTSSYVLAQDAVNSSVKLAIKKYKTGNYIGCLQDCQAIVKKYPSNAVAYYYMAISYVQAGKKDEAIKAYSKVLSLNPNSKLSEYATTGKRCLETPDKCVSDTDTTIDPANMPGLDKFISAPFTDGLSDTVKKDYEQIQLNNIKNEINNNKDLDDYNFKNLNKTQADTDETAQKKPTNDEIVAALKVLNAAGLNPYSQMQSTGAEVNPYDQEANYQNPQMTQLNMLMGGNNQKNDNNVMMNMLPFMLAQNKNGTNNYSPQLMQAVIMNSIMPNFGSFNVNNENNDKNQY